MEDFKNKLNKNYIKNLHGNEQDLFCKTIREHIVERVLLNGGHLASNLGIVELTVALHKVFDFPEDKIIFDVGHQSYVHKILSGRFENFETLRKYDGLSGFPKTQESEYDSFNTGHASTSISAALGIARSRDNFGDNYNVIAVIGDGALGGGMAFEALNDVGESKTKLIIILNDNEMSIDRNVGGLSAHLSMLRTHKGYMKLKNGLKNFLNRFGRVGKGFLKILKKIKRAIALMTVSSPMFEELGLSYIGIIDGHDIEELCEVFKKAKNMPGPVIIHTQTVKGKGYKPAEENPGMYHGVSCLSNTGTADTYTKIFSRYMTKKGENNNIAAITAAMSDGCGLNEFANKYPDRFFDVGIAEQHAVTLASGLAINGITPVFAVYSTFLQRGYDQILHDVCLQNLHVVFSIDRAGIVGEDGETHQGVFDLSYLTHLPNMTILAPSCRKEFEQMLDYAVDKCNGPVAVRYPKATATERECVDFELSKPEIVRSEGMRIIIVSIGRMLETALETADVLKKSAIDSTVINLRTVKPINVEIFASIIGKADLIITIEDNIISGGAGQFLANSLDRSYRSKFLHFGFEDEFITQGTQSELFNKYNLTGKKIAQKIIKEMNINE